MAELDPYIVKVGNKRGDMRRGKAGGKIALSDCNCRQERGERGRKRDGTPILLRQHQAKSVKGTPAFLLGLDNIVSAAPWGVSAASPVHLSYVGTRTKAKSEIQNFNGSFVACRNQYFLSQRSSPNISGAHPVPWPCHLLPPIQQSKQQICPLLLMTRGQLFGSSLPY